jgi:GDP-4-dehydro-6-deoxy-D-mannose reductase
VRQLEHFRELAAPVSTPSVVLVRPFNVIAPDMPPRLSLRAFADRIRAAADGTSLRTGNLAAIRDFIDIADLVTAFVAVAERARSGEVYNVCSGRGVRMRDVVDMMIDVSGKRLGVDEDVTASPGILVSVGSHAKLTDATGWTPTRSLADSLEDLVKADVGSGAGG